MKKVMMTIFALVLTLSMTSFTNAYAPTKSNTGKSSSFSCDNYKVTLKKYDLTTCTWVGWYTIYEAPANDDTVDWCWDLLYRITDPEDDWYYGDIYCKFYWSIKCSCGYVSSAWWYNYEDPILPIYPDK